MVETIRVRAEGNQIRRGIYRDFPMRYRDRYGNRMVVDFELLGVERDGRPEPHFTETIANGVRINTGNDDFLPVPADITYTLRYRTTRQLGFFDAHDEIYWNVTGLGWAFPIDGRRRGCSCPRRCRACRCAWTATPATTAKRARPSNRPRRPTAWPPSAPRRRWRRSRA